MPNEPASPVVKLDYFQLFVNKGGPSPEPEDLESFVAVAERLTLPQSNATAQNHASFNGVVRRLPHSARA